jgi:hypothetical protein
MAPRKTRAKKPVYRAVLAIDPGASAGVSLHIDGEFCASAACAGHKHATLVAAIKDIIQKSPKLFFVSADERLCVVEDGWGKGIGAKTLDRRRGLCMGAAESAGFNTTIFLYPSTWHSEIFGGKVPDTKTASMEWCRAHGHLPETHDEADAICLGYYVSKLQANSTS